MRNKAIISIIIVFIFSSIINFSGEIIKTPIDYVISKGYMTLDKSNKFNNKSYVTREDLATILYRIEKDKTNWDNVVENAMNSTVFIENNNKQSSGVLIDEKTILTVKHGIDVSSSSPIMVMSGFNISFAKVKAYSDKDDLCLLELSETFKTAKPVTIANSIKIGDEVITIGSPLSNPYSLSRGVVSNLNYTSPTSKQNFIQFDMAINEGNSGGGVFNSKGELVTIVQGKIHESYGYGLSFGASRSDLFKFLEDNNIERK